MRCKEKSRTRKAKDTAKVSGGEKIEQAAHFACLLRSSPGTAGQDDGAKGAIGCMRGWCMFVAWPSEFK